MTDWTSAILPLALAGGLLAGAGAAMAGEGPVVVELYTSQGCSSCPPVDELLAELVDRPDVLPLALHVDYWDYIGWTDTFGRPLFTQRQKGYARAAGHRTIYTPQMVIDGQDHIVGFRPMDLADRIQAHRAQPDGARIQLDRAGDRLTVRLLPGSHRGDMLLQLVRYRPAETVAIQRGENAGRTIDYVNIVTEWTRLAEWDGQSAIEVSVTLSGDEACAILLQAAGHGPILAAARAP